MVECKKRDGRRHAISQLLVVATSLGLLSFFTIQAMLGSYRTVGLRRARNTLFLNSLHDGYQWFHGG